MRSSGMSLPSLPGPLIAPNCLELPLIASNCLELPLIAPNCLELPKSRQVSSSGRSFPARCAFGGALRRARGFIVQLQGPPPRLRSWRVTRAGICSRASCQGMGAASAPASEPAAAAAAAAEAAEAAEAAAAEEEEASVRACEGAHDGAFASSPAAISTRMRLRALRSSHRQRRRRTR